MHLIFFFITSQNPFEDEGVSACTSNMVRHLKSCWITIYTTIMAYVYTKIRRTFSLLDKTLFLKGTDWFTMNYNDLYCGGRTRSPQNNGIVIYGDEVSTNLNAVANGLINGSAINQAQFNNSQISPNESNISYWYNRS
jgi:hypothetical protein